MFKISILFITCIVGLQSCQQSKPEKGTMVSKQLNSYEIDCKSLKITLFTPDSMIWIQEFVERDSNTSLSSKCIVGPCLLCESSQLVINFNLTPTRLPALPDKSYKPAPYLSDTFDIENKYPIYLNSENPFKYERIRVQDSYAQIRYSTFIDIPSGNKSLFALTIIYFESIGDLFFRIYIIGDHSEKAVADARDIITSLQINFDPKDVKITCLN